MSQTLRDHPSARQEAQSTARRSLPPEAVERARTYPPEFDPAGSYVRCPCVEESLERGGPVTCSRLVGAVHLWNRELPLEAKQDALRAFACHAPFTVRVRMAAVVDCFEPTVAVPARLYRGTDPDHAQGHSWTDSLGYANEVRRRTELGLWGRPPRFGELWATRVPSANLLGVIRSILPVAGTEIREYIVRAPAALDVEQLPRRNAHRLGAGFLLGYDEITEEQLHGDAQHTQSTHAPDRPRDSAAADLPASVARK